VKIVYHFHKPFNIFESSKSFETSPKPLLTKEGSEGEVEKSSPYQQT